jgi:adenylylsulfate kinase-like enzyme
MMLNLEQYKLSEEEHQAIYEQEIAPLLFNDVKTVENPVVVMFGGQPGCGKSDLVDAAVDEFKSHGGAVKINGDDLRANHPLNEKLLKENDIKIKFC